MSVQNPSHHRRGSNGKYSLGALFKYIKKSWWFYHQDGFPHEALGAKIIRAVRNTNMDFDTMVTMENIIRLYQRHRLTTRELIAEIHNVLEQLSKDPKYARYFGR